MKYPSPLRRGARTLLEQLDRRLDRAYGSPESELGNKDDPLDEAIYIILTFQTDLARARSIWSRLRSAYPLWAALDSARVTRVAAVLREGGLHRQKARTIKRLLTRVRETTDQLSLDVLQEMSDDAAERVLRRLPGLSWKGARCVLLYSLGRNVLPIDGNTFRILKRVGVLSRGAVYRRRATHDAIQEAVPRARRRRFHVNLVVHGQRTCLPVEPKCFECPVRTVCSMIGVRAARGRTQRRADSASARTRELQNSGSK
jgi:endonuclease-3